MWFLSLSIESSFPLLVSQPFLFGHATGFQIVEQIMAFGRLQGDAHPKSGVSLCRRPFFLIIYQRCIPTNHDTFMLHVIHIDSIATIIFYLHVASCHIIFHISHAFWVQRNTGQDSGQSRPSRCCGSHSARSPQTSAAHLLKHQKMLCYMSKRYDKTWINNNNL